VYDPDYTHKKKKRIRVTVNKQQIKLEFESKKYPNLEKYIIEKLKLKWSPEQIAGRMKLLRPGKQNKQNKLGSITKINLETTVSHETIYKYIYNLASKELEGSTNQKDKEIYLRQLTLKVELSSNLRHNKGQFNRYRRRQGTRQRAKDRDHLNKKRIDVRPGIVETRSRIGDW
jgi:IS30 family transposase